MRSIALLQFLLSVACYVYGEDNIYRYAIVDIGGLRKFIINETCQIKCSDMDTHKDFNCVDGYSFGGLNVTKIYDHVWLVTFTPVSLENAHQFCVNCASRVISCYFLVPKSTINCADSVCSFEFPNKLKELFIGVISATNSTLISNVTVVTVNKSAVSWPSTAADPKIILYRCNEYTKHIEKIYYQVTINLQVYNQSPIFAQKANQMATEATTLGPHVVDTSASGDIRSKIETQSTLSTVIVIVSVIAIIAGIFCIPVYRNISNRRKTKRRLRGLPLLDHPAQESITIDAEPDRQSGGGVPANGASVEPEQVESIRPSDLAGDGAGTLSSVITECEYNRAIETSNGGTLLRSVVASSDVESTARTPKRILGLGLSEIKKVDEASADIVADQLIIDKSNEPEDYPLLSGESECGSCRRTLSEDELSKIIEQESEDQTLLRSSPTVAQCENCDTKMAVGSTTRVLDVIVSVKRSGDKITLSNSCEARSQSHEDKEADLKRVSLENEAINYTDADTVRPMTSHNTENESFSLTPSSAESCTARFIDLVTDKAEKLAVDEIHCEERADCNEKAIKERTAHSRAIRCERTIIDSRSPSINVVTLDSQHENAVLLYDAVSDKVTKSPVVVSSSASIAPDNTCTYHPQNVDGLQSDEINPSELISFYCHETDNPRHELTVATSSRWPIVDDDELSPTGNRNRLTLTSLTDERTQNIRSHNVDYLSSQNVSSESDRSLSEPHKLSVIFKAALDKAYAKTVSIGEAVLMVGDTLEDAQKLASCLQPPMKNNYKLVQVEDKLETNLIKALELITAIGKAFPILRIAIRDAQKSQFEKIHVAWDQCSCIYKKYIQLTKLLDPSSCCDVQIRRALNAAVEEIEHIGLSAGEIKEIMFPILTELNRCSTSTVTSRVQDDCLIPV